MIALDLERAFDLDAMRADGIVLDPDAKTESGMAYLTTIDADVAEQYEMRDATDL